MNQVRWVTAALALAALLEASGPARFAAASGVGGARAGAPRPWLEGLAWVNTRPLTRADLAGKVVVVEFWTFDCINCRRTVPAMKRLEQEYRGASDVAIVQFRRIMVEAARKVRDGGPAIGTSPRHVPQVKLKSFEGIVPKTTPWTTLGVAEEELALQQQASIPSHP